MNILGWTILITFHVVMILLEYGIGRLIYRYVSKTWERQEGLWFYWIIGCITLNLVAWPIIGIIKLIQWI